MTNCLELSGVVFLINAPLPGWDEAEGVRGYGQALFR